MTYTKENAVVVSLNGHPNTCAHVLSYSLMFFKSHLKFGKA